MFEFAWPWLLLLLPLPWLVRILTPAVHQQGPELQVPFYSELQELQRIQDKVQPYWRNQALIYSLIWLLLLTASARPQLHGNLEERPQTGRDLLIAMDISNSMLYSDMTLNGSNLSRIDFLKYWLDNFIEQRHGDRLGLILFGSQAYLQAPLTYDHHSIKTWIQDAQPGIAGETTSIGDAIGLAIKRLRERPAKQRVLLLITDGANNSGVMSPAAAAQLAEHYQIKIYTIGIGSRQASLWHETIDTSSLELDEQGLTEIAQITNGQYFHISNSHDFTQLVKALNQLEPSADYQRLQRKVNELYSWPLAAALLLSMLLVALRLYRTQRQQRLTQGAN